MAEEKKTATYEEFQKDFHSFYAFNKALERGLQGDDKSLYQLAVMGIPEDEPDREGLIKTIYKQNPQLENDKKVLFKWINVTNNKISDKLKNNLKNNLEGIVNDADEKYLVGALPYLEPNPNIKNEKYGEVMKLYNDFISMQMIYQKVAEGKINPEEGNFMLNKCLEDYSKRYDKEKDADILDALSSLAAHSQYFRSVTYTRVLEETGKEFEDGLGKYGGIKKYTIDSLKDNYEVPNILEGKPGKNITYLGAISGINPEAEAQRQAQEAQGQYREAA